MSENVIPTPPERARPTHIAALDGVRGMAVLAVMIYHFAHVERISTSTLDDAIFRLLMTGWIGVDIFFVLSGYLITSILLQAVGFPYYFRNFYFRRALRIFPPYYLYLGFLLLALYPTIRDQASVPESENIDHVMAAWPWFVLFASNLKQFCNGAFFGTGSGHLWSLAIEEQFYIVWPLLVLLVARKALPSVCVAFLCGSLTLRIWLANRGIPPDSIYTFTPARLDGLVAGAFIAASSDGPAAYAQIVHARKFHYATGLLIALLVFFGSRAEANYLTYTIGFSVLAVWAAWLILLAKGDSSNSIRTLCESRVLMTFGKFSYALYLVHPLVRTAVLRLFGMPIIIGGTEIPWLFAFELVCGVISFAISWLSWCLIEGPIHTFKDKYSRL